MERPAVRDCCVPARCWSGATRSRHHSLGPLLRVASPLVEHQTPDTAIPGKPHHRRRALITLTRPLPISPEESEVDSAWCPAPALGPGEPVNELDHITDQTRSSTRTLGTIVVLDPDGVLDDHAITEHLGDLSK